MTSVDQINLYRPPTLAHTQLQDLSLQHCGAGQFKDNFSHTRFVSEPFYQMLLHG